MGPCDMVAQFRAKNDARFPKLKEIRTHPALDCFPLMKEDEFARLVWSIRKVGLIRPILQDEDGRILDGRCRFLACDIAGVEPELAPPKDAVAAYLYAANAARRHLDSGQRAIITVMVEDTVPEDDGFTGAIMSANLVRRHDNRSQLHIADALVDEPDFPESLVRPKARLVARHPDLVRRIGDGTLRISEAYQAVIERDQLAAEQADRAEAFERLRFEAPILAAQVDEGALTVDQALTRANEDAEHLADHAEAIRALSRRMVADAIEIGQRLIDAKRLCGHGNWLPWLDREFGWSDDTAINYMRVAELAKSRNIRDLNVPVSGLYLLARPSTPQSVRDDVLQRAADGEAISFEDIKREVSGERPAVVQLSGLAKIAEQLAEDRPDDPLVHELQALVSKMSSRED